MISNILVIEMVILIINVLIFEKFIRLITLTNVFCKSDLQELQYDRVENSLQSSSKGFTWNVVLIGTYTNVLSYIF